MPTLLKIGLGLTLMGPLAILVVLFGPFNEGGRFLFSIAAYGFLFGLLACIAVILWAVFRWLHRLLS